MIEVPDTDFICIRDMMPAVVGVSSLAFILACSIMITLIILKFRRKIKVLFFMKFGWHPFDRLDDTDITGKVQCIVN